MSERFGSLGRHGIQGEAGVAKHAGQQVVEIVRDAAGQNSDALHLLRLAHLVFLDAELLGGAFLSGDVELNALPDGGAIRAAGGHGPQQGPAPFSGGAVPLAQFDFETRELFARPSYRGPISFGVFRGNQPVYGVGVAHDLGHRHAGQGFDAGADELEMP